MAKFQDGTYTEKVTEKIPQKRKNGTYAKKVREKSRRNPNLGHI